MLLSNIKGMPYVQIFGNFLDPPQNAGLIVFLCYLPDSTVSVQEEVLLTCVSLLVKSVQLRATHFQSPAKSRKLCKESSVPFANTAPSADPGQERALAPHSRFSVTCTPVHRLLHTHMCTHSSVLVNVLTTGSLGISGPNLSCSPISAVSVLPPWTDASYRRKVTGHGLGRRRIPVVALPGQGSSPSVLGGAPARAPPVEVVRATLTDLAPGEGGSWEWKCRPPSLPSPHFLRNRREPPAAPGTS